METFRFQLVLLNGSQEEKEQTEKVLNEHHKKYESKSTE